jgi:hypothetical protein
MFTVCSTHGIGLAERLERKASGIESIEAGRIYVASDPIV